MRPSVPVSTDRERITEDMYAFMIIRALFILDIEIILIWVYPSIRSAKEESSDRVAVRHVSLFMGLLLSPKYYAH